MGDELASRKRSRNRVKVFHTRQADTYLPTGIRACTKYNAIPYLIAGTCIIREEVRRVIETPG